MRFYIVHELRGISTPHSGRMRVRASCPLGLAQAEALAGALATVPGISEIRVNPRLGSLLFHYEDAESRETALTLFVGAGGVDGPLAGMVDDPAPGPGEATLTEGLMPVFQYVLVRPLLPMALRIVNSVVSAVPFLFKGVRAVLRGALNVDVLDAAAIGASLIMRDFRTVSLLTLLLGLGETLEYLSLIHI